MATRALSVEISIKTSTATTCSIYSELEFVAAEHYLISTPPLLPPATAYYRLSATRRSK
ncbi:hypothetical protein CORMATOL_00597 [Corynebacterium matruchotii ATCC 33806]|jgi:hypothetical protein|uniref:Uncharacterized protein n=1 Tax=Corynebacterium matruchotii ATCC 33806 TaxID=566549 RepID=C0E0U7_9CORY|nr:hypothetical protein CORMATOL_00597 [Corynebacterium matruchotii ATCC 33806]